MTGSGYTIGIYRDHELGWRDVEAQFATLKDAKNLANAIAAETEDGPVLVRVQHTATKTTLYVAAAGRIGDLFPRSEPTC